MRKRDGQQTTPVSLTAYLEGEVTPSETAAVERELAASPVARARLAELRSLRDALTAPSPELQAVDLIPTLTRAIDAPPPRRRPAFLLWTGGFAAAAGLAALVALGMPAADSEFRAKSSGASAQAPERWSGVQMFRLAPEGRPQRVADQIAPSDGLLFSYTNLGPRPFSHLAIFGIDARGEVRWFHPAYEHAGANPSSISVRRGDADVALAEVIHHELPPGPLTVHALFTARPVSVLEIEAMVANRGPHAHEPLTLPDSVDHVRLVEVTP